MSLWLLALAACHGDVDTEQPAAECSPPELDWGSPVTTLTRRIVADPVPETPTELNPALPDGLAEAEAAGLGGWQEAPGEPRLLRDDLAPGHGADTGPQRRSLAMVLHQSDAQLADAESPTRVVGTDAAAATQSAARPEELYAIHGLDALIRTANALAATAPIDFSIATGDNADSVQANETRWFVSVWDGVTVHPDSGADDQQIDADCNDPIAEFTPVGADFPWYAVAGNHDVLVQGNFQPTWWTDDALGTDAPLGTRDLSLPGGPLTYFTEADPERDLMDRAEIASIYLDGATTPGPIGHGFTADNVTNGSVNWVARPIDGIPLSVIAVDANPLGSGTEALLTVGERDGFLIPALQAATDRGDLIVLTSHYGLANVAMEGGGSIADLLFDYPNVVLVMAGHFHSNRIRAYGEPGDPSAFWEILTASTIDWPAQGRLVELVVNGDGTLSIYTTIFDFLAPEGSMAYRARTLAAVDLQSGWRLWAGDGEPSDRNTELVQVLPDGFAFTGGVDVRSGSLP